jgi:hypothetical protein
MVLKIFIIHSNKDMDIVEKLKSKLKQEGFKVYIAEEIKRPGKYLPKKVQNLIRKSDCVLVLYTKNASRSKWVNQEIGGALTIKKPIIPIVEKGVYKLGMLEGLEYIPFEKENPDKAIISVINSLKKLQKEISKIRKEFKDEFKRKLQDYIQQLLQLIKKERERPLVVQLIQFFIVPLKEWFSFQLSVSEFEEFDIEKLDRVKLARLETLVPHSVLWTLEAEVRAVLVRLETLKSPNLKILYIGFNFLLEKLNRKKIWNEKIQYYNELAHSLYEKIYNELEQGIRKFVEENQDVERTYEKTEAKNIYTTLDAFKKNLVYEFYAQYKNRLVGNALSGTWSFVGEKIFEQAISYNKSILEEIKKLIEEGKHLLNELISFLEQILEQLRKEYNITPLEQKPLISFSEFMHEKYFGFMHKKYFNLRFF